MTKSREPNLIRASATALKLRQRFGLVDPRDLALEDVAMAVGVLVLEGRLDGAEARLIRSKRSGLIRVDREIPESGRRRFAIAHELGHWLLHGDVSQLAFCSGLDIHSYAGSLEELEASAFAAHLLMPSRLMRSRYKAAPSLSLFCEAAGELDTTVTATAVRVIEVTNDPCLVAFTSLEDGRVRWWRRSSKCPQVWLERRQPVLEGSVTADVMAGRVASSSSAAEEVDPAVWFSHIGGHERFLVTEEATRLGHYETILTLLSIAG